MKPQLLLLLLSIASCERQPVPNPKPRHNPALVVPAIANSQIVAGSGAASKLIYFVQPTYPKWARKQHIQGTVAFSGTIGKDGHVRDLTFVSGPELLAPYAKAAVLKWKYERPTLNGASIELRTQILINFTQGQ